MLNISSHRSNSWSKEQMEAAGGIVIDLPEELQKQFSQINPVGSVKELAGKIVDWAQEQDIKASKCICMVQGEARVTVCLVNMLLNIGFRCVAGTTARESVEEVKPDGSVIKTQVFRFKKFMDFEI